MAYKIRAILDVKKDVFRDIIVDESINLEKLHFSIAKSFGFKGQEMASFYRTDDNWEQGEEIPLFDMSEDGSSPSMQSISTTSALKKIGDKLNDLNIKNSSLAKNLRISELAKKGLGNKLGN